MLIKKKLAISNRSNYLSLIDEGFFLKAYNQSAYIINQVLKQDLKLCCNIIKKLNNQPIVYCAFPKNQITNRFHSANKTTWGFEVQGEFDLTSYQDWFDIMVQCYAVRFVKNYQTVHQSKKINCNIAIPTIEMSQQRQDLHLVKTKTKLAKIQLTNQQLTFLQNWKRGAYSPTVTESFVESLKKQLSIGELF